MCHAERGARKMLKEKQKEKSIVRHESKVTDHANKCLRKCNRKAKKTNQIEQKYLQKLLLDESK